MLKRADNRDDGDDVMVLVVCAGRCRVVLVREKKTDLSQALLTSPDLPSVHCNLFQALPQVGFWGCHQAFAPPTKAWGGRVQGLGQVGRELVWGGELGVLGNLMPQARCTGRALLPAGGLGAGWGLRLPVCSAQTEVPVRKCPCLCPD